MTDSSANATVIGDRGSPPPLPSPDELPAPGALPVGSRLPLVRNALFTGRVAQLKELARVLLHGQTSAAQVLHGMGGMGKTQLAVEFAYRYGRYFHGVHWIDAAQLDLIDQEIAACGEAMALPEWPKETSKQAARTLWEWKRGGPRLVILDTFPDTQKGEDDVRIAREWLARFGGGQLRLLLTTRWSNWPFNVNLAVLPLHTFSSAESLDFLRHYLPAGRAAGAELEALAERLGHLPLALELAGRYLEHSGETPTAYRDTLDRLGIALRHPSLTGLLKERGSPTNHDLNLITTFAASWNQVKDRENGKESCYLFLMAGQCAPNTPIPRQVLRQAAKNARIGERVYDQALLNLSNLSLLHQGDIEGITVHPLLAEYAQLIVDTWDMTPDVLDALSKALVEQTGQANETGQPDEFAPLEPHTKVVARAATENRLEEAGTLWNNLGYYQQLLARYGDAETTLEQAVVEAISTLEANDALDCDSDYVRLAVRFNNLASVRQDKGNIFGALDAYDLALMIFTRTLGPNHPHVATLINNRGTMLHEIGDLYGALGAFRHALWIDEQVYGPTHPKLATDLSNLGSVLYDLGDLVGALEAFERARAIDAEACDPYHPHVARDINNLGKILYALGDLDGARAAYERALTIDEQVYGLDHPQVAHDARNLGDVLRDLGDSVGARVAYDKAEGIEGGGSGA